jgi:tetratricopeptide (TPR) repeat protein
MADRTAPGRAEEVPKVLSGRMPGMWPEVKNSVTRLFRLRFLVAKPVSLLRRHWIVTASSAILVSVLVAEWRRDIIWMEPLQVSPQVEERGYTAEILTDILLDEVQRIRLGSGTKVKRRVYAPISEVQTSEIKIPKSSLTIQAVVQYLSQLGGRTPTKITGDFIFDRRNPHLLVRVTGTVAEQIPVDTLHLEAAFKQAAQYIVRSTDPYTLASYLLQVGDTAGARVQAFYTLQHPPAHDDVLAYNLLGLIHDQQKNVRAAIDMYQFAIAIDPDNPMPYLNLANIFLAREDYDKALRLYTRASRTKHSSEYRDHIHYSLAGVLGDLGRHEEAAEHCAAAIALNPTDAWAHYSCGVVLLRQNRPRDAILKYRQALDRDSLFGYAYLGWAGALLELGAYPEATQKFSLAARLLPQEPSVYSGWGVALTDLGLYVDAEQMFRRAVNIDSSYVHAHLNWAIMEQKRRSFPRARELLQRVIDLDADGLGRRAGLLLKEIAPDSI